MTRRKYDTFVGIDNGSTGSIGIIQPEHDAIYMPMPTISEVDFHKDQEHMVTRVNHPVLETIICNFDPEKTYVTLERPLYNNRMFAQSMSAARAFESVLILLDKYQITRETIDSTQWQNMFFPGNRKSRDKGITKAMSNKYGKIYFPDLDIMGLKDYDGILIAKFCQMKQMS